MGALFFLAGLLLWLAGAVLGLYEIGFWLKKGFWAGNTLALPFGHYTPKDWSGVTQILVWLWEQPLWAVSAGFGTVLLIWGAMLGND